MQSQKWERAINEILMQEPTFLPLAKSKSRVNGHPTYICPECQNGTGQSKNKRGEGLCINKKASADYHLKWICFNCGLKGDNIDLYQKANGITGYREAVRALSDFYKIPLDLQRGNPARTRRASPSKPVKGNQTDYTDFFLQANRNLTRTDFFSESKYYRGISLETFKRCNIGYIPEWRHPEVPVSVPTSPRVIIPTSNSSYLARDTRDNLTPIQAKYSKSKVGAVHMFNLQALQNPEKPVYVVEGEFDALSLIEIGCEALALGSANMFGSFLDVIRNMKVQQKPIPPLIIALDSDTAGRETAQKLAVSLSEMEINFLLQDIWQPCKDANELLQKDRQAFTAKAKAVTNLTLKPDNTESYVHLFMGDELEAFKREGNKQTGFSNLDAKSGGLHSGLYCVAAISSLGKTTFCHQLADNLAESGEDVLFFSLEQSRLEMVTKSIARETAKADMKTAVTSLSIRKGYTPRNVQESARRYVSNVSDRVSIIEGNFSCNVETMQRYIETFMQRTGRKPTVIIDYLQIIPPSDNKKQVTKDIIDGNVTRLKQISRDYSLTIFIISSVNRANYMTPISFESLKESGCIEFSCDVVWGLQLQCLNDDIFDKMGDIKKKRKLIQTAKAENPRKIELVCLKNRFGIASFSCYFDYYPKFDYFVAGSLDIRYSNDTADDKQKAKRL